VYFNMVICARVAEWLGNGLQIRIMQVRLLSCTPVDELAESA